MRIINVTPEMTVLPLGRLGENERTQFVFDVNEWLAEYPDANIGLMVRLPHAEDSYPVILSDEGDGKYAWTVTSADLSVEGTGKCQLKAIKNQVIVKSKRYNTRIDDALDGAGDAPAEWESWLDAIQRAAGLAIIKDGKLRFAINDAGHLIMSYTDDVPIDGEGDSSTTEDDVTWIHKDLGPVEAYAQAVAGGYTGTKAEWIAEIANASTNAQLAEDYKEASEQAKDDAQAAAATASAAYNTDLLAPVYTSYTTYKKGDFVIYDGGLYRAKETHSSTAWNVDNWESVTFNTVVRAMQEKADNLLTEVGDEVIYDFIDGKYISTTTTHTVGDTLSLTPSSSPRYVYTIREVSPGDVVTIEKAFTYGESSPYIFIDADNKILAIGASGTVTDVTVTAPENTAKLVINSYRTDLGICYVNKLIKDRKADKVENATAGNFAALDSNGNLADSGKKASDFLLKPETAGTQGQVLTSDGNGGQSWEDPTGGDPTEIIDDTAGEGDTDKVWSADKSSELLTEINSNADDIESISKLKSYSEMSALDLEWGVGESGNRVVSTPVQVKAGSSIKFQRTTEATGKLYAPVSLYYDTGAGYTYKNFGVGTMETFASDCEFYISGARVSTSDIPYADLAVLAKDCFVGTLYVPNDIPIVNVVDGMRTAQATDVGKALSPATVVDGKVTSWQFVEGAGSIINDTAGSGATTQTWSADKLNKEISAVQNDENPIDTVSPASLMWGVSTGGTTIETTPIKIKKNSTLTYSRTEAATGKLYSPAYIYTDTGNGYSYEFLNAGNTKTFDADCMMYIKGFRVSTSDIPYADLAVLAKDCFTGTLYAERELQIVADIKDLQDGLDGVDEKIAIAVAPALGGVIAINPTWTNGEYYNSSLEPASHSALNRAKVDISAYVNASLKMTTYAMSAAFCGFTDANDSIIEIWNQNSEETKVIPINAKWLYISNAPGNLSPAVFACSVTLQNASISVAYLDVATGLKEYDSTKPYVVGNLCTKAGKLMHCINNTTGTYDPDDWQETTIIDEFGLRDYVHPITKLKGLSWKACGDSITAGSNGPSYVPLMANLLGITTYTNSGIGGAYLATCYNGSAVTDDIVTLFAGTNDFGLSSGAQTLSAFETSVRTVISNFKTNNQNARLYMITPIPRFDKTENENHDTLLDFVDVMEEVCAELNVPCLNLYERCGITAQNYATYLKAAQGDLVHPNAYGAVRIAVEVANFVSEMEAIHRVVAFR